MPTNPRLFDVDCLENQYGSFHYDLCDKHEGKDCNCGLRYFYDFIDSEIRRNVREALQRINLGPEDYSDAASWKEAVISIRIQKEELLKQLEPTPKDAH